MKEVIYEILINENLDTEFMSLTFHLEKKGIIDLKDYKLAYSSTIILRDEQAKFDVSEELEKIYERFNINHPIDYKSRSLSIGDIVKLKDDYYYVKSIGFEKLQMNMIKGCESCYFRLIDGCKLKRKNEFLRVKGCCESYQFIKRKTDQLSIDKEFENKEGSN